MTDKLTEKEYAKLRDEMAMAVAPCFLGPDFIAEVRKQIKAGGMDGLDSQIFEMLGRHIYRTATTILEQRDDL